MADEALPAAPYRLVLFDGVCGFCDRLVRWLIARDPDRRLCFSPLQGEAAAALRLRHPQIPRDLDTMVYVEVTGAGERVYLRSEAMFRVLREVRSPWRRLAWLGVLPRFLTERLGPNTRQHKTPQADQRLQRSPPRPVLGMHLSLRGRLTS